MKDVELPINKELIEKGKKIKELVEKRESLVRVLNNITDTINISVKDQHFNYLNTSSIFNDIVERHKKAILDDAITALQNIDEELKTLIK